MKSQFYKWEGAFSLLWVVLAYLIIGVLSQLQIHLELSWFVVLILLATWWGVGLVFAISGIKHGHWTSRVCAGLTISAFLFLMWIYFKPVLSRG